MNPAEFAVCEPLIDTTDVFELESDTVERSATVRWGWFFAIAVAAIWGVGLAIGFQYALAALTALGFVAALIGIGRPVIGLFGVGLLCTLDALTRVYLMGGGLLRWNTFNYWLLFVSVLFLPLWSRQRNTHLRVLRAFVVLLLLELLFSPGVTLGVLHILNVVAIFGLLVYFLRARDDDDAWYWMGMINGLTAALGGVVFYLQFDDLPYIDQNAFCYFPITAIFSVCMALHCNRDAPVPKWPLVAAVAVNCCWVFLSGSRGGILVAGLSVLFLLGMFRGQVRRMFLVSVSGLVMVLLLTQFADFQERSLGRIRKLLDTNYSLSGRTSGRYDLAVGAWRIFLENPLGVGTGGYGVSWSRLESREGLSDYGRGRIKASHTGWLKTLAENGVPGFLLFASFIGSFAFVGWRKRRQELLPLGLLATASLSTAFVTTEFQAKGLWFLAAAVIVLLHRDENTSADDQ